MGTVIRKEIENNLALIVPLRPDGVITVKDGIGTVSHSDTANVAMVYTSFPIPFPDGAYGVDFEKMLTLVKAYKTTEIEISTTSSFVTFRSGGINNRTQLLNIGTLQSIRPKSEHPLPCIVEIETAELLEVVTFIETISNTSRNEFLAMDFSFDGENLSILCMEADETNRAFSISQVLQGKGDKFKSKFSFDYVRNCVKAIGKVDSKGKIKVSIGNGLPVRLEVDRVMYVVANRNDSEGDDQY